MENPRDRKSPPKAGKDSGAGFDFALSGGVSFLEALISSIPSPVFYKNADGVYLGCNKAFESFIGLPPEDIEGKTVYDIAPAELARVYDAADRELLATPGVQIYEARVKDATGSIRDVVFYKATFNNPDGTIGGLVGVVHDITERKRIEGRVAESEKELSAILKNMPDTFYRTDLEGRVTRATRAVERLLGYTPEEVLGRRITDFYVDPEARKELLDDLEGHGGIVKNFEARLRRKDGREIWVSSNSQYYYDDKGNVLGVEGLVRDITARRISENAMRPLVEETASVTGEEFLQKLTRSLGESIGVRYAFISRLVGEGAARTITFWDNGKLLENVEYRLSGTPCHEIYSGKEACFYPSAVQSLFPGDEMLVHMGVQSYYGAPFKDSHGNVIGHLGVMDDKPMTGKGYVHPVVKMFAARAGAELERMISEREFKKLKNAIEQSPDTVVITDSDGVIEYVNPAAERITGYSAAELIGSNPRKLKSGRHDEAFYRSMWQAIKAGQTWSGDVINRKKSGELYYEEMTIAPVQDEKGVVTNFVAVKRDVTERIRAAEELRAARDQAESATRLKDKFVSLVSHDLRSPIASIFTLLRMFEGDASIAFNERQKKLLKSAVDMCEGLIRLIDQLLNISMLQTGRIRPRLRLVSARALAARAAETVSQSAMRKGIEIVNDVPPGIRVLADADLFAQVVQNLLSNAVKFCKSGDTVTVFVPDGRGSTIAVRDTGARIDGDILPNLFKSEVRTTTLGTAGEKGTGLGLPLCRDIMEAHGGSLTVESVKGEGSVFHAALPGGRPLILLVDDQEVQRDIAKGALSAIEADIVEAESGKEALSIIESAQPQLVVTDIMMPDMDGLELLEAIRENPRTRRLPVIVMTSQGGIEVSEKAFRLGADDFVTKPVSEAELVPRARRFLE